MSHAVPPDYTSSHTSVIVAWLLLIALIIYLVRYNSERNNADVSNTVVHALGQHRRLMLLMRLGNNGDRPKYFPQSGRAE